jgi:hypothetical protein
VTDWNSSAAPASLLQPGALRHQELLSSRRAFRKLSAQLIHALVQRSNCDLGTDLAIPLPSGEPNWPSGLIGVDSFPLVIPAEVHAAR